MSHTIEFDRQFIRSTLGFTPCWLSGDNNVTVGHGRNERVARHWGIFYSLIGVTKEDILEKIKPSLGGYQQHWKKNGKWVDDKGLLRWVETGCKTAATIEEIIEANRFADIRCYVMDFSGSYGIQIMDEWISKTVDFDDWLYRVKQAIAQAPANTLYPTVRLSYDQPIKHPDKTKRADDEKVLIKKGRTYLVDMASDGSRSSWTYDKQKASVFSFVDAELLKQNNMPYLRDSRLVSARVQKNPSSFIIKIESKSSNEVTYVNKLTKSRFYYTGSLNSAKHYSNKRSAKNAAARVQEICDHNKKEVEITVISAQST